MAKNSQNDSSENTSGLAGETSGLTTGAGTKGAGSSIASGGGDAKESKSAGTVYYAQRRILHDDKVLFPGDKLPKGFPQDSLDLLLKDKDVAETPPPPPPAKK